MCQLLRQSRSKKKKYEHLSRKHVSIDIYLHAHIFPCKVFLRQIWTLNAGIFPIGFHVRPRVCIFFTNQPTTVPNEPLAYDCKSNKNLRKEDSFTKNEVKYHSIMWIMCALYRRNIALLWLEDWMCCVKHGRKQNKRDLFDILLGANIQHEIKQRKKKHWITLKKSSELN